VSLARQERPPLDPRAPGVRIEVELGLVGAVLTIDLFIRRLAANRAAAEVPTTGRFAGFAPGDAPH